MRGEYFLHEGSSFRCIPSLLDLREPAGDRVIAHAFVTTIGCSDGVDHTRFLSESSDVDDAITNELRRSRGIGCRESLQMGSDCLPQVRVTLRGEIQAKHTKRNDHYDEASQQPLQRDVDVTSHNRPPWVGRCEIYGRGSNRAGTGLRAVETSRQPPVPERTDDIIVDLGCAYFNPSRSTPKSTTCSKIPRGGEAVNPYNT